MSALPTTDSLERLCQRIDELEADLAVITGSIKHIEPIAGVQQQPSCE